MIRRLSVAVGLAATAGLMYQSGKLPAGPWTKPAAKVVATAPAADVPQRVSAEGRVVARPGAEVVVGSEMSGLIVALPVVEKSVVRKGDVIAELRSDDLRASLAEAEARIVEAEADIRHFDREVRREQALLNRGVGAYQPVDEKRHSLELGQARLLAARATRDRLRAEIDKTRILAPIDGVVTARHTHRGEIVDKGTKLVTIVDLNRLRIEAEVDEFDAARVDLGATVKIVSEGYEHQAWNGSVEEIPDAVTTRRIRPEDPGRPTDARVLAVKVTLPKGAPLRLGQRIEVEIESPPMKTLASNP